MSTDENVKKTPEEVLNEPIPEETLAEKLSKHQDETAGAAAIEVLRLVGNTPNLFLIDRSNPDAMKRSEKAYEEVLAEILVIFAKNRVGITDYKFVFDGIKSIFDGISSTVGNHTNNLKLEIDSRFVGAKNPINGKYDVDHATHEDLINAVMKVREATGDKPEDFFTMVGE